MEKKRNLLRQGGSDVSLSREQTFPDDFLNMRDSVRDWRVFKHVFVFGSPRTLRANNSFSNLPIAGNYSETGQSKMEGAIVINRGMGLFLDLS